MEAGAGQQNGGRAAPGRPSREGRPTIGVGEGERVEFKESWNDDALRNLASFANTHGGRLYVGVDKHGRLLGTDLSDEQQQRIVSQVANHLRLVPIVRAERHHGVDVLVVEVGKAPTPVRFRGNYPVRSGTVTTDLPPERWAEQILRQAGRAWDGLPSDVPADEADAARVRAFVERARVLPERRVPDEVSEDTPVGSLLASLELVVDGRLTYAGVLLFGKNPQRWFENARIRVARIRSNDELEPYPDVTGTVLEQIDRAMRILGDHNPTRMTFPEPRPGEDGVPRRHERPKYPPFAIREAVVNAVVHRDYTAPGDVEVRVYDDRIAVWNPGRLPSGLTVDQLRTPGHPSVRRNPALARVAYMAGLVERWGTGTTRMIERCRELGLPDPVFAEEGGGFRVVLRSAEAALTREALSARGLEPRLVDAVLHARRAGRITASAYMALAGVAESTALRDLRGLVEQGLLVRHGARGRGVFYTVPDTASAGRETADSAGNTP